MDLSVDLGGLRMINPVIAASGTFGYGLEYSSLVDLNGLGAFSTKALSLKPKTGNPVPRVIETSSGMLNSIGLENIGIDAFLTEKLTQLTNINTCIIVNFFGETSYEYVEMALALSDVERLDALEKNVSCPNIDKGGLQFSSDPGVLAELVSAVRKVTKKFLIVKLSPNVTDITLLARAAEKAGADALSVCNTFVGMSIDLKTRKPHLANKTGGLSGPAIKPLALNLVYKTAQVVKIPVIGIGGITSGDDAVEFLLAGAKAVQIGTANLIDPASTISVIDGIRKYCLSNGIKKLCELKMKES